MSEKQSCVLKWHSEILTGSTKDKEQSTHKMLMKDGKIPWVSSFLPFGFSLIFQIFTHECDYCPLQACVIHGRLRMGPFQA